MKSFVFILMLFSNSWCCEVVNWNPFRNNAHHIAALILARGGSKGIPLKNLAEVGGKSLLKRSIEAILDAKGFSSIWVSTNHKLIAQEAEKHGVNIHWRSDETATDSASSISAVREFISHHLETDYVALIQCTSPFLKPRYIQKALDLLHEQEVDCAFSVTRSHKFRWQEEGDKVIPLNFDPTNRPRRQDWKGDFIENGMFYVSKRELINRGYFQNDK